MIEIGAQWVHGEKNNRIFSLALATGEILHDITTKEGSGHNEKAVTAYVKNGEKITVGQFKEYKDIINIIYETAEHELVEWDKSLGEYFIEKYLIDH